MKLTIKQLRSVIAEAFDQNGDGVTATFNYGHGCFLNIAGRNFGDVDDLFATEEGDWDQDSHLRCFDLLEKHGVTQVDDVEAHFEMFPDDEDADKPIPYSDWKEYRKQSSGVF